MYIRYTFNKKYPVYYIAEQDNFTTTPIMSHRFQQDEKQINKIGIKHLEKKTC